MILRRYSIFVSALLLAGLRAQNPPAPLTLEDCIRMAQAAQSSASLARQEVEAARYGVKQARAAFLPQTQIGGGFTYNTPVVGNLNRFVALNGVREYSTLFGAALQIDTSGRLRAGLARAHADQDIAGASLNVAERDLKRAVTAAFFRLSLARHLVEVAHASLDEARTFEQRTKLLFQGGEVAQADMFKASAETAFLEQAQNAADLDSQLANQDLAAFWTAAVDQSLNIVDSLSQPLQVPDPSPTEVSPYLRRPEFKLYNAQKQGFEADYRRARADLLPQAGVTYEYGLDSNTLSFSQRGSAAFVNLTIPVFDWFRAISAARQSQVRAQMVDSNVQIAQRTFSREYQSALARVKMIYLQISITETQVKNSEENLRLSHVRYEGGEGSALEVVSAQTQLAQARSNYYTAIANYLNARSDAEVAAGR